MSQLSDSRHVVSHPRPGTIPLSTMLEYLCQKTYTDLMRLVDLLPSKTDLEKKIELAKFFSRTRNLFIRLEALVKWANSASKVDKCEVTLTLLSEALDFPWRILSISLLVCDPEISAGSPLLHPLQTRFLHSQAQSRILYQNFDKRPPLLHLYEMLPYTVTIHTDPLDPQRPLCLTHHPKLSVLDANKIGSIVKLASPYARGRERMAREPGGPSLAIEFALKDCCCSCRENIKGDD
ncbi:unnamed protein product [Dibothriocephalus latus]|uniref:Mediator of RNA polymerase II transcription subunit 14 n=1 Tax=Dibothriocephalus latus TaxID=60516 RepID=A0A3P7P991_DIBLA|nr:unnamed protein product [Dibothriocephalus latus]